MKRYTINIILLAIVAAFSLVAPIQVFGDQAKANDLDSCQAATIHYRRRNADYDGWGLHVWGPTPLDGVVTWNSPLGSTGEDDFGLIWIVEINPGADQLNYIIHRGEEKDPGPDQSLKFEELGCEIWQVQGKPDQFLDQQTALDSLVINIEPAPTPELDQVILHYRRIEEDYDGWGLHIWGPAAVDGITWSSPLLPTGYDEFGIYWIIDMQPEAKNLEYIVHKGDLKDPGPDQKLDITEKGNEAWLIQGDGEQFHDSESAKAGLIAAAMGDIKNKAQAHWLSREFIGWPVKFSRNADYSLHYDPDGNLRITPDGLVGGRSIPLEFAGTTLTDELAAQFPHLWNARLLQIPDDYLELVPEILKGQYAIRALEGDGSVLGTTALQIPGVLDDLYANNAALGVTWDGDKPTISVWSPTAKSVRLHIFDTLPTSDEIEPKVFPMQWDPETGIWSLSGDVDWKYKYYLFEVKVFVRQSGEIVTNLVTDPYSFSLSKNSTHSQIVDLEDPNLLPIRWTEMKKPDLVKFTDIALYELHIRDFSIRDASIPEEQRGTYLAFTHPNSHGIQHLKWLADQGVTHIHLLPAFDFATINEEKAAWQTVDWESLTALPPDSEEQQNAILAIRGRDGFNWGYDPFHYTVPEGSYSVFPDGHNRILEFRKMVQSLNETGLRVVMDVVYNHTNASGQNDKSVLDRIVPGYYHRLDEDGRVTNSTCCQNTATEHAMMRKLMIDSVLTWATAYKVDGFRFDLMGHHMKSDMEALRAALDNLSQEEDGVDGTKIYVYGEGWDFGEVADNARGINASQVNMAGTGIGTFNDRIRDAVRGGSPFSGQQEQGFVTGLYTDPNKSNELSPTSQLNKLLKLKDHIRISLVGNLADYEMENYKGEIIKGSEINYNGQPAGYTNSPEENILYVSAHDNETLFDAIQYKAPFNTSLEERVKMVNLALSLVSFSQGVPFYHSGSEILRSKSMDRDSYDSTDWYNALDWTYQDNNWGHGLPPQDKNGGQWPIIRDLLGQPELAPSQEHILFSKYLFGKLLQIRTSSVLFRLHSSEQMKELVRFHNTGPDQIPGLIVMSIQDNTSIELDPNIEVIYVLFNADPAPIQFQLEGWQVDHLDLHPVLIAEPYYATAAFDPQSKTFTVPGRSSTVFMGRSLPKVIEQEPTKQEELGTDQTSAEDNQPLTTIESLESTAPTTTKQSKIDTEIKAKTVSGGEVNWGWFVGGGFLLAAGIGTFAYIKRKMK